MALLRVANAERLDQRRGEQGQDRILGTDRLFIQRSHDQDRSVIQRKVQPANQLDCLRVWRITWLNQGRDGQGQRQCLSETDRAKRFLCRGRGELPFAGDAALERDKGLNQQRGGRVAFARFELSTRRVRLSGSDRWVSGIDQVAVNGFQ